MNLAEFRTNLRLDMGLSGSDSIIDAELDRAVVRAVNDLSRFLPREQILGIRLGDQTITDESFTSDHDTAVSLGNSPIEHESETVTSDPAGTTYTRDTDYTIDYWNGTITVLSTGSMADATGFLISYERDARVLDVSSIDSLEIVKVEVATTGGTREIHDFTLWDNQLYVESGPRSSELSLTEKHSYAVYYLTVHTAPTESANGTYPEALDELVTRGSSVYILIAMAGKRQDQAITDLASARTALGSIAAIHTSIATDQGKLETAIDAARTAILQFDETAADTSRSDARSTLASISLADITNRLGDAETAADKVATAIESLDTPLSNAIGQRLNDEFAQIETATGLVNSELDALVEDPGESELSAASNSITAVSDSFEVHEGNAEQIQDIATSATGMLRNSSVPSAEAYLETGDGLIDSVNVGNNPPGDYNNYAQTMVNAATTILQATQNLIRLGEARLTAAGEFVNQARVQIDHERLTIEGARAYAEEAAQRINYAQTELGRLQTILDQGRAHNENASVFTNIANAHIAEQGILVQEAATYQSIMATEVEAELMIVQEAQTYLAEAAERNSKIQARLAEIDRYVTEAQQYFAAAQTEIANAEEYRNQANQIQGEYFAVLRERTGTRTQRARVSRRQPA